MDKVDTEKNEKEEGDILKTEPKNEDSSISQKKVDSDNIVLDNEVMTNLNGVKNIDEKMQIEKNMEVSNGDNNDPTGEQNNDNNDHMEKKSNDDNDPNKEQNNDDNDHMEEQIDPENYITIAEKLTAEELITCHQNKKNVQDASQVLGGVFSRKTINWTGATWEQDEIERRLENWSKPLSHSRVETRNSMNQGEWRPDLGKVKLNRWSGKMFEFMGTAINNSNMELWPEEALYLLECSQLDLQYGEVSMSLQRAYTTLLSGKLALERYLVYFKLLKFGYRVVRHQGDLGITAYERCIGLDKYDKVKRKIKPLTGTQILADKGKGVNGSSNDDGEPVIIKSDVMKLEEDTKIKSEDVVICDNSTGSKICDNINAVKESESNLKRKTGDVINDGDISVTDEDDNHPLKKMRVESNAVSIDEIITKVSNHSDDIDDILEVSDSESELKQADNNVASTDTAVTSVDDIPSANAVTVAEDDIVMLSSDEECQPQKSPKYKVIDEEEGPDIVDLSSDEECSAPSTATGIQFPSSNYSNASTSQQNVVPIDDATFIEAAVSKVSTNEVRLVNENIQLLQKDLPTGFVNPGQFFCSVCKVTCNSDDTYKLHISGKKHKISVRRLPLHLQQKQLEQQQQQQAPRVNNRSPKPSGSSSNPDLYCSACDVQSESLISLRVHLMGKRHIKMLKNLANPHAAPLTDDNGIVEMDITEKPKFSKDSKKNLGLVGMKEIPNNPSSNEETIRIISSKASLMNNIPNCYGKATVNFKVMDQFVPAGCNPSKQNYTITIEEQPELNPSEDLELEKEVDEKDKYKYTCRVCDLLVPDEKALIAHIRSRQHAAKLNKPELASLQDNSTITLDDYGVVKDKDRASRGYYPKHEQEVFFKGGMTGTVYNFGYYVPLKEHSRKRFQGGKKHNKGQQHIQPQDRQSGSKRSYIKERLMRGITADDIAQEDIAETDDLQEKETTDNSNNIVDKDQDVINLSSDDETENNLNEKSTKEVVNNIKQVDGANDSESDNENADNNGVQDNDEDFILEDLTKQDSSFSSFDSEDSSNFDDVESHPELRLLKKSSLGSLWSYEGKVGPLICPEMAEDMNTIFKRIQGAPQPRKHFRKSSSKDLEIAFDCYKSSSNYRKSINMAPDYRVVLVDPRDLVPDNSQLNKLQSLYRDRVPILFAIVDRGTVSFITMDSLNLPTFYDDIDQKA